MLPEKYIKDLESSSRRGRILTYLYISIIFTASFLLVGPLLHEIVHVLALEFKGCIYYFEPGFSILKGFRAEVKPLCSLENSYLVLFYSAGYLATLVAGGILNIFAMEETGNRLRADLLAASGTGVLLSVLSTIGIEGDLLNLFRIFDAGSYWKIGALFVILGVFMTSLKGMQILLRLEGEE